MCLIGMMNILFKLLKTGYNIITKFQKDFVYLPYMKYIIFILALLITSCGNILDTQSTRLGKIVKNLSKTNQIAISDGYDIFLITPDSILNDSTQLKIVFATKDVIQDPIQIKDSSYHHNLFTVYKSDSYQHSFGTTYTNLVSDGTNSIQLQFPTQTLVDGEKVIVIYRGEVTNPTYKVIK
jgi:archaellum component FlaG (FlaF/FlaG flagellin family)